MAADWRTGGRGLADWWRGAPGAPGWASSPRGALWPAPSPPAPACRAGGGVGGNMRVRGQICSVSPSSSLGCGRAETNDCVLVERPVGASQPTTYLQRTRGMKTCGRGAHARGGPNECGRGMYEHSHRFGVRNEDEKSLSAWRAKKKSSIKSSRPIENDTEEPKKAGGDGTAAGTLIMRSERAHV